MTVRTGALFLLFAAAALADITGKWSGTARMIDPPGGEPQAISFELTQTGNQVTGTTPGPNGQALPLQKGHIQGDKVSFQVVTSNETVSFELTASDKQLQGTGTSEHGGERQTVRVELKKKTD